jgi:hypothetical protein
MLARDLVLQAEPRWLKSEAHARSRSRCSSRV